MTRDWRIPYRSRDVHGSAEAAGSVGARWLDDVIAVERLRHPIESMSVDQHGGTTALYLGTELLAAATIFRDPMNFAVLIRWRAPE